MPYSLPQDFQRFETLITEINRLKPSFSIFIGDTKSGSSPCSDQYNKIIKTYFSSFKAPLIYSPGDNEWTDCHRPLAGAYDPLERLEALRIEFFNTNLSLGKTTLRLQRQSDIDPQYSKYVENSYWIKNNFLFVSIHIPGSNNNNEGAESAIKEYQARNQANLAWIDQAFSLATQKNLNGIVFAYQADMFYKPSQLTSSDSGYRDTLESLISKAEAFNKPVLLINGDSHRIKIDQPLNRKNQKIVLLPKFPRNNINIDVIFELVQSHKRYLIIEDLKKVNVFLNLNKLIQLLELFDLNTLNLRLNKIDNNYYNQISYKITTEINNILKKIKLKTEDEYVNQSIQDFFDALGIRNTITASVTDNMEYLVREWPENYSENIQVVPNNYSEDLIKKLLKVSNPFNLYNQFIIRDYSSIVSGIRSTYERDVPKSEYVQYDPSTGNIGKKAYNGYLFRAYRLNKDPYGQPVVLRTTREEENHHK
jgi:hypothetical protein